MDKVYGQAKHLATYSSSWCSGSHKAICYRPDQLRGMGLIHVFGLVRQQIINEILVPWEESHLQL